MNSSYITDDEIALIKAMLSRGKQAGFTAQKILSYCSRPERTINVARIYEIRDGERGGHIPAASEAKFHLFLTRFAAEHPSKEQQEPRFSWKQPPAYIGVFKGRISVLRRTILLDDKRKELRHKLLTEQHRLACWLAGEWSRFQVDQRLKNHVEHYSNCAAKNHLDVNIFELDDEFRVIRRSIGEEAGGFGEAGEAQWDNFSRNHVVLADLYPEMREYRAALAATNPDAQLAEEAAKQATAVLRDADQYVAPEVPELIQKRLDEDTRADAEAGRKRAYDVAALLNMAGAQLFSFLSLLPKLDSATAAAAFLRSRFWPPLRAVLEWIGWL